MKETVLKVVLIIVLITAAVCLSVLRIRWRMDILGLPLTWGNFWKVMFSFG